MQIGTELKNRRLKLGWTQQDLADKAKVSRPTIINIEKNSSKVNLDKLADCFDAMDRVLNLKVTVKK